MISEGVMKTLREEYPRTSWAIWSEDFPRRGCIEEDSERFVGYVQSQRHRLRPDLVFLGLNPSTDAPSDFANFHSPSLRHADRDLRIVVEESGLEGGFMTDCSDTVEPRGERLDLESEFLQTFFAQLKTLPGAEYTVVCFGRRVFDEIRSAVKSSAEELAEGVSRRTCTREGLEVAFYSVYHYSQRSNPRYLESLRDQLTYLSAEFVE